MVDRPSSEKGTKRTKISRQSRAASKVNNPAQMRRCQTCKGVPPEDGICPACRNQGGVNLGNL